MGPSLEDLTLSAFCGRLWHLPAGAGTTGGKFTPVVKTSDEKEKEQRNKITKLAKRPAECGRKRTTAPGWSVGRLAEQEQKG
jgi:hypothetical protein